jgi:hypothetical protein
MNPPNANPIIAANPPPPLVLPAHALQQILINNQPWQSQRGLNPPFGSLGPAYTQSYMEDRKTLDPPLPWTPSAADRRNALLAAQQQRNQLQTQYPVGSPLANLASPLALALISEEPAPSLDIARPRRKNVLVFDDLKTMSRWFTIGRGRPGCLIENPNINADVLNPNPAERLPWMRSVQIVQVTFIDNAQYHALAQPSSTRMEYAQEAFAELANAMGRMALRRLHIIVPPGIRVLQSIDDPGVWEITHIRGLTSFDVQADQWSVNPEVVRQLTTICKGQRVRWQPVGMAYQPIWRPPENMYTRPPNTRYDWRNLLQPTPIRSLLEIQHDWLNTTYTELHNRQLTQLKKSRSQKRTRLRQLRNAWANLDAYVVRGQNAFTARAIAEFAAETQQFQRMQRRALFNYTTADTRLNTLKAAQRPATELERRQLSQQIMSTTTRRRGTQRRLREAHLTLTEHTQRGLGLHWPTIARLIRARDDAQQTYHYARKERRAVHRGKDATVIRDIRRAARGQGPYPRLGPAVSEAGQLLDAAGDRVARQLRDVSPTESEIDPSPDFQ